MQRDSQKKCSQIINILTLNWHFGVFPAIFYLFKDHNENTSAMYGICLKAIQVINKGTEM